MWENLLVFSNEMIIGWKYIKVVIVVKNWKVFIGWGCKK